MSEKRRRSQCASALLELTCHQPSDENEEVDEDAGNIEDSTVKECQTGITVDYISGLEKKNASLKEKLKMICLNEDSLKKHNAEVRFHTGLPNWSLLLCLFTFRKNSSPKLKSSRGLSKSFDRVNLHEVKFIRQGLGGIREA